MIQRRSYKRIVLMGDLHCGHRAGLTPPRWRNRQCSEEHVWRKFTRVQEETWKLYAGFVKLLRPIDCLVVNGDLIDGRGEKSGGVELITADRNEQVKIAEECCEMWDAPQIVITEGTPYHAGDIESWEAMIDDSLRQKGRQVKIGAHEWVDVNGYVFDVKHHVGSSTIPHGRYTIAARDELWNTLWHEAGLQPRADMVVRSHVHYCVGGWHYVGGKRVDFMTLPALQAMGTRWGARRMSHTVDWGLMAYDIDKHGEIVCEHRHVRTVQATAAKALRV